MFIQNFVIQAPMIKGKQTFVRTVLETFVESWIISFTQNLFKFVFGWKKRKILHYRKINFKIQFSCKYLHVIGMFQNVFPTAFATTTKNTKINNKIELE